MRFSQRRRDAESLSAVSYNYQEIYDSYQIDHGNKKRFQLTLISLRSLRSPRLREKILILFLFFTNLIVAFACGIEGHFLFNVSNNSEEILYHGCYDAINLGPHKIEYILTKERAEAGGIRPNARFTQNRDGGVLFDLLQENGYSLPHHRDFSYSGYDRGHMAPNADFNDTYENAVMTFFIANIWPQTPNVNRSEWLITEYETRRLASEYLIVRVLIIVDEFSDEKIADIQIPSSFKRYVYDFDTDELIYEIIVYQ